VWWQNGRAEGVWGDENFLYLANTKGGLLVYRMHSSMGAAVGGGAVSTYCYSSRNCLTLVGHDNQSNGGVDDALKVWGDGNFIYLANGSGGLHTYSVDSSGTPTHLDSDDQGNMAMNVWGDGNFIYLANYSGGLHTYSVDGSGNLTHIDSDNQGGNALGVWGDGNFIYLAQGETGLHVYSVDGSGYLTHLDSDDQSGVAGYAPPHDYAMHVVGDGNFLYLSNYAGGLHTYSVDNSGNLTHIDFHDVSTGINERATATWVGTINTT
tara:strand:+ start:99 stop:893 length:795 start_codon:yes stop_codon:yes gene_type:complete